jgi:prolipoprotein diacylglyceryltransferase
LTLVGGLLALWAARRFAARLRDGDLLSFWFIWYGALRALLEPLRSPDSQGVIGISVVIVICGVVIAVGAGSIVLRHRGPRGKTPAAPAATVPPAD